MRGMVGFGWAALAVAAGVAASAGGVPGQGMRLIPQAGLYFPLSDLGRASSGSEAVEIGRRESTLGLGLALELSSGQTVSFRVSGVYGTESGIPVDDVGCADCEARGTVAAVTGAVVWRPLPRLIVAQPYLLGGAGLKRYDFDLDDARAEGWTPSSTTATSSPGTWDWAWRWGSWGSGHWWSWATSSAASTSPMTPTAARPSATSSSCSASPWVGRRGSASVLRDARPAGAVHRATPAAGSGTTSPHARSRPAAVTSAAKPIASHRAPQLWKVTKKRGAFPNPEAVRKVLYLAIMKASERWTRPVQDWTAALNHFALVFPDRVPA